MAKTKERPEEPPAYPEGVPSKQVPVDPATGKPYKKGEIPPGCNEPV